MRQTFRFCTATLIAALAMIIVPPKPAYAQIAGYNVIAIHGFILTDIINPPSRDEVLNRRPIGSFWAGNAEGYLNWSGAERLEGGIAQIVFEQAKQLAANGVCLAGCVLVTHSTGDLIARYFLAHQDNWLRAAGYEPLNIVASIDLSGAGGGTDLADVAVAAANGWYIPLWMKLAAGAVLGMDLDITDYDELGVVIDLSTSVARNTAMWPSDIPRLRFSVNGGDLLDPVMGQIRAATKVIIKGADDTVIPAHSICGSASPRHIESCSNRVDYKGELGSYRGPEGLLHNHYPILMAHHYDHFDVIKDVHRGKTTFSLNQFVAGLNVDFATYTYTIKRAWWEVWKKTGTWQFVKESEVKSFTRLIYDTLNN
jgi:hypothetical protein